MKLYTGSCYFKPKVTNCINYVYMYIFTFIVYYIRGFCIVIYILCILLSITLVFLLSFFYLSVFYISSIIYHHSLWHSYLICWYYLESWILLIIWYLNLWPLIWCYSHTKSLYFSLGVRLPTTTTGLWYTCKSLP